MAYTSFGAVIPVTGPNVGFPGNISRIGDRVVVARLVSPTAALNVNFGDGVVELSNSIGGYWQSFQDFLSVPANAATLQQKFAGIAVRNVRTMLQYTQLGQSTGTVVKTTATQATIGSLSITVAVGTGISVGQAVEAFGVQANTLVTSVVGTTVGISLPTTQVMSGVAVSFTSSILPVTGYYAPGQMAEAVERGSCSLAIANGVPQANQPVYVRVVANPAIAGTFVGDFEAVPDNATTALTITTTVGSTALTTSAATGLAIGQMITGPGIPANTYLVAGAGTAWTMSKQATATVAAQPSTFQNNALLGTLDDPFMVFRTGQLDVNGMAEITIKNRHAA
jgi:hypothetical protein